MTAADVKEKARARSCATCKYYEFTPGQEAGECRADPPTVHVVVVSTIGGAKPMPLAAFPMVKPATWCGHWTPEQA